MDNLWQNITQTVYDEFHDLADAAQWTRAILRLSAAVLLGGVLGFEREIERKSAGLRTHMLVALGSALIILAPELAGTEISDMSRVIQGLVTGIGFLGAGTILKLSEEQEVKGLTTAAGIWITAAVGMACGLGRLALAVLATVLALMILSALGKLQARLQKETNS
jgi:putative Mg2+ transporter-C (MgtC) family protein